MALIETKKTGLANLIAIKMETVREHSSERMTWDPPTGLEVRQTSRRSTSVGGLCLQNFEKLCKSHFVTLSSVEKKQITHEYAGVTRPLTVSNSGLAIVVSDQRIMVYSFGHRTSGV